jgi:hypothetical protein
VIYSETVIKQDLDRFVGKITERLKAGATEYGDRSFLTTTPSTVDEIQEELADVCGWSFIAWCKLERLKAETARLEARGPG